VDAAGFRRFEEGAADFARLSKKLIDEFQKVGIRRKEAVILTAAFISTVKRW